MKYKNKLKELIEQYGGHMDVESIIFAKMEMRRMFKFYRL